MIIKYVTCPKDSVSKKTYLVSKKKLSEILGKNMRGFVRQCNGFLPAMLCRDSWERRNSTSCPIPRPCCLAPPYPPFFDPWRSTTQSWRWWWWWWWCWWQWWWWWWWWQWLGFCRWQLKVIVVNADDGQCWVAATYPPFFYLSRSWLMAMVMVGIMLMIIESDGAVNDDGWCGGDSELSFTCSFLTSLLSPRHFLARLPSFS